MQVRGTYLHDAPFVYQVSHSASAETFALLDKKEIISGTTFTQTKRKSLQPYSFLPLEKPPCFTCVG